MTLARPYRDDVTDIAAFVMSLRRGYSASRALILGPYSPIGILR